MSPHRREQVTIAHQTVVDDKAVAVRLDTRVRNVYRRKNGEEFVLHKGKYILVIKGMALTGGKSDPTAKPKYK